MPDDPADDLSPEERRLRQYMEEERTHGGWPEELQREHPDVFPVHHEVREERANPRAVRRLLMVTVPAVALLLWAQATDTLIGNAWLLALLVAMAGLTFYLGFLSRETARPFFWHYRVSNQAGFIGLLVLIGVAAYFGVRKHHTIEELAALVDPIPRITGVTYVPTEAEVASVLAMARVVSAATEGTDPGAALPASPPGKGRYWLLKTALSEREAVAFYRDEEHHPGWVLSARREGVFVLHRGEERLVVVVGDDWPRPGTRVSYIYRPSP